MVMTAPLLLTQIMTPVVCHWLRTLWLAKITSGTAISNEQYLALGGVILAIESALINCLKLGS